MKRCAGALLLLFVALGAVPAFSQVRFRTVVPQRPIAPGESFPVQYILENADQISDFSAPQFDGFRVVSGPNLYSGDRVSSRKNLLFTLAALNEGRFKIFGASCFVNGRLIKSNDAYVQVVSPEEPGESPYFLMVGEDPFKKIDENLFLKLIVDKHSCFIGEPLVASFQLYSRLQSRSNVIKNPGFYGFSVYDMEEVNDQTLSEEKMNGHWFQVHTIRKVQLYPLQAGSFTIDPMEISNEVEFSRSIVNKKTEQEVTERMYGDTAAKIESEPAAEVYKVNLKTDPLVIRVKSLPHRNVADTFAGAVGHFFISAIIEKDSVEQNEESYLTIKISGSGNFQRVTAPMLHWPQQFEGFEPSVTDTLNAQFVPLTGQRSFTYAFLCNRAGQYTIPPVPFSFFDLKSRSYKTVSTKPVSVFVRAAASRKQKPAQGSQPARNQSTRWIIAGVLAFSAVILFLVRNILIHQRRSAGSNASGEVIASPFSVGESLGPIEESLNKGDKDFYRKLNIAVWDYFTHKFQLSGSQMNKEMVRKILLAKKVRTDLVDSVVEVIRESEVAAYTNAELYFDRKQIFENAREALEAIDNYCS